MVYIYTLPTCFEFQRYLYVFPILCQRASMLTKNGNTKFTNRFLKILYILMYYHFYQDIIFAKLLFSVYLITIYITVPFYGQ